ncbi:hypothetical protein MNBD_GAMMA08-2711 [hydrothermal vent metagenome]|uniref:Inner membrane protein YgaP-like transmembrane domain-containing protein n=1 Tax=hydrothermal vent metagenome TaxID=652676 RepID=A0A3B0XXC2_9ZZZZ
MSERANRFLFGFTLIAFLLLEWDYGIYAIIIILIFEGVTNLRIPIIVNRLRYAMDGIERLIDENENTRCLFCFEAERMMRFMAAFVISLGTVFFKESLWFLPWFVSLNLILAGTTGFCPLVMFFRKLNFK